MISRKLFFPKKLLKTFLIQLFSLFLITGIILSAVETIEATVEKKYSYLKDNEYYEDFNIVNPNPYTEESFIAECGKRSKIYSELTNNAVEEYYPCVTGRISVQFPNTVYASFINISCGVFVCDDMETCINFRECEKCRIIKETDKEEGVYISSDLYEDFPDSFSEWNIKYSYFDDEIDEQREVLVPVKGILRFNREDLNSDIFMNFELYHKYLKSSTDFEMFDCFYKFHSSLNMKQINKMTRNDAVGYSKAGNINNWLAPFEKIINCGYILLVISVCIMEVSLCSLTIQKNLKNKEIDTINNIFYRKKKDELIRLLCSDAVLLCAILLISCLILSIISLILYFILGVFVIPSYYVVLVGTITFLLDFAVDLISKSYIQRHLYQKF